MDNSPATLEEIDQFVGDLLEAWNSHDIERIKTFYAAGYEGVDVGQAEPQRGPRDVHQTARSYLQAFPDLRFLEEGTVVQDNRVVLVWTAHGTHKGKFMRIPPTQREIVVRGVSLLTIENGKIKHGLYVWDVAGLLRAIGLLPEL